MVAHRHNTLEESTHYRLAPPFLVHLPSTGHRDATRLATGVRLGVVSVLAGHVTFGTANMVASIRWRMIVWIPGWLVRKNITREAPKAGQRLSLD